MYQSKESDICKIKSKPENEYRVTILFKTAQGMSGFFCVNGHHMTVFGV